MNHSAPSTSTAYADAIADINEVYGVTFATLAGYGGNSESAVRAWRDGANGGPTWPWLQRVIQASGRNADLSADVGHRLLRGLTSRSMFGIVERPLFSRRDADLNHDGKVNGHDRLAALVLTATEVSDEAAKLATAGRLDRHEHSLAVVRKLRHQADLIEAMVGHEQGHVMFVG